MTLLAIASITVREALRRKVQVNLLLFGLFLVATSYFVSELTLGEMHRVISDLGLSSMELIGTLLAAFLGAGLVAGDIERRVIYPVIAKPVSRTGYVVGRYLGLSAVLLGNLAVMAAALSVVLVLDAGSARPLDTALLAAFAGIALQLLVVAAVAVLFSSLTSTTLASIFTLALAIAGHLSNEVRALSTGASAGLAKALWYVVPNLAALTLDDAVIYHRPVPASAVTAAGYGLAYAALAVALASIAFSRRDLR